MTNDPIATVIARGYTLLAPRWGAALIHCHCFAYLRWFSLAEPRFTTGYHLGPFQGPTMTPT